MATLILLCHSPKPLTLLSSPASPAILCPTPICQTQTSRPPIYDRKKAILSAFGVGSSLILANSASAVELGSYLLLNEPRNALSLPTWAIHVSSVVEWVTAMVLVWQYGERSGHESWKGLSWGMVPLLGGAFCACTWHFFYNSQSLEILVALQAALTVVGNATMCLAAYRIYKSSKGQSENL